MRRFLILIAFLVPACSWSDLDAEFLSQMPERGDLHVSPPTSSVKQGLTGSDGLGTRQDGLQSDTFKSMSTAATQINGMVDGLTAGLDTVRQFPPSTRETDRRIWGPYPDTGNPGFDLQVVVTRKVELYTYEVQWRAQGSTARFATVIQGDFKGEKATGGSGEFTLDFAAARALPLKNIDATSKSWVLTYQHSADGKATDVWLAATPLNPLTGPANFHHHRDSDGGGTMSYDTKGKISNQDLTIAVVIEAEWNVSKAGTLQTSATTTWGTVHDVECWGADLERTYLFQNFTDGNCAKACCDEGDFATCQIPPAKYSCP